MIESLNGSGANLTQEPNHWLRPMEWVLFFSCFGYATLLWMLSNTKAASSKGAKQ